MGNKRSRVTFLSGGWLLHLHELTGSRKSLVNDTPDISICCNSEVELLSITSGSIDRLIDVVRYGIYSVSKGSFEQI